MTNNEIFISEDVLQFIEQRCDREILEPCKRWLNVYLTKGTNYWDCTDFLTVSIPGVERVDKIQLVSLFMTHGKINFLADFCNFTFPIDLWNNMKNSKLIEENEYRFLFFNWKPENNITKANL